MEAVAAFFHSSGVDRYADKDDRTPVTRIDREIEALLKSLILEAYPDHAVVGEEGGTQGKAGAEYVWYVDPVDGTKNLIRGLPHFSTQLALFRTGVPVLGVSCAPGLQENIIALRGEGAFLGDTRLQVSSIGHLNRCYLCHGNIRYFSQLGRLEGLLSLCSKAWANRGFGDFWGYHLLAQGRVDIMLDAKTSIWDIAAVSVIVEEAGGRVTDMDGLPIDPHSSSVVATNGLVHEEVLEILAGRFT